MPESDEYITPPKYVNAARNLMGGIELDPATRPKANEKTVKADRFWTKEDDCLSKGIWEAESVWMNPPYSRAAGTAGPYVHRLIKSWSCNAVKQAVILLNTVTANKWWQPLWEYPMCFAHPRIKFLQEQEDGTLEEQSNPRYDNVFIYLPNMEQGRLDDAENNVLKFQEKFIKFGHVTNLFDWFLKMTTLKDASNNYDEWYDKNKAAHKLSDSR